MKPKELYNKIRDNHALMMVLCCGIPLLLLFAAVYLFGISKSYLYWFIIILCPLMHILMMKHMHKGHSGHDANNTSHDESHERSREIGKEEGKTEGKKESSCH